MNYTSIKQSKTLLELGLNLDSSDMMYWIHRKDCRDSWEEAAKDEKNVIVYVRPFGGGSLSGYGLPCWSVGALLDLLPSETILEIRDGERCLSFNGYKTEWYHHGIGACYEMVVWLLENNYIKNK